MHIYAHVCIFTHIHMYKYQSMQNTKTKVHIGYVCLSLSKWALVWIARATSSLDFCCFDWEVWASIISLTEARAKPWPPLFCGVLADSPTESLAASVCSYFTRLALCFRHSSLRWRLSQLGSEQRRSMCQPASWHSDSRVPCSWPNPSRHFFFIDCVSMLHLFYNSVTLRGQVCLLMHNAKTEPGLQEFACLWLCIWNPTMYAHLVAKVWLMINIMGNNQL